MGKWIIPLTGIIMYIQLFVQLIDASEQVSSRASGEKSSVGVRPTPAGPLQIPASVDRCYLRSICGSILDGTKQQAAEVPVPERNCFCDELCVQYDDCCQDHQLSASSAAEGTTTTSGGGDSVGNSSVGGFLPRGVVTCQRLADTETGSALPEVYIVSRCARESTGDPDIQKKCEDVSQAAADRFYRLPVTGSGPTRALYRNVYCAICAGEPRPTFWRAVLRCGTVSVFPITNMKNRSSSIDIQSFVRSAGCPAVFVAPRDVSPAPRSCKSNIARCDRNWPDRSAARKCRERVDYVYAGNRAFRNRDCAVCNYVNETYLRCEDTRLSPGGVYEADDATRRVVLEEHLPYIVTLDFNRGRSTVAVKVKTGSSSLGGASDTGGVRRIAHVTETVVDFPVCPDGGIYDPFSDQCRQISCRLGYELRSGHCVLVMAPHRQENAGISSKFGPSPPAMNIPSSSSTASTDQTIEESDIIVSLVNNNRVTGKMQEYVDEDIYSDEIDVFDDLGRQTDERDITAVLPTVASGAEDDLRVPHCPLLPVNSSDYIRFSNGSLFVVSLRLSLTTEQYFFQKGLLFVCSIDPDAGYGDVTQLSSNLVVTRTLSPRYNFTMFRFESVQRLVSFIGAVLCSVTLFVHFMVYITFVSLRADAFGKAVLCLVGCLFAGQLLYIVVILSSDDFPGPLACFYISAAMQYCFLSSFFWLSVLSIDVFRRTRFRSATVTHRGGIVTVSRSVFRLYAVYASLVPAIIVSGSLTLSILRLDGWYPPLEVGLPMPFMTSPSCWIMGLSQLLLYALPICLILAVNVVMYVAISFRLCCCGTDVTKSTSGNGINTAGTSGDDIRLYKKRHRLLVCFQLTVLFGVTWLSAFAAVITRQMLLWYLFIAFDAAQGPAMCVTFLFTRKVWRLCRHNGRVHRIAADGDGNGYLEPRRTLNGGKKTRRKEYGRITHVADGRNKVIMLETSI